MSNITKPIYLPVRTIHNSTEIVDSYGDLLLIAADDSVDMEAIAKALNSYIPEEE